MAPEELKTFIRIKKLHAMAESAEKVGNLAEAAAFMEAVEKMLAAHNMEMSSLSVELHDLEDPLVRDTINAAKAEGFTGSRPEKWAIELGKHVARAHFCDFRWVIKSTRLNIYGRRSNVQTSLRMLTYLRDTALRLGTEAYNKEVNRRWKAEGHSRGCAAYRWNWLEGFAAEVGERYAGMRQRIDADAGMSLVLVKVSEEASAFAKENSNPGKGSVRQVTPDDVAREHGRQAARTVPLKPTALSTDGSAARRIGSGV